nr:Os07g0638801 [Ipomoea batatas]
MRPPNGVRAGERHHLVQRKPFPPEILLQLLRIGQERRQVSGRVIEEGDPPVAPPRGHAVIDPSQHRRAVSGRKRHDVGAGNGVRALRFHPVFCFVDHVEAAKARLHHLGQPRSGWELKLDSSQQRNPHWQLIPGPASIASRPRLQTIDPQWSEHACRHEPWHPHETPPTPLKPSPRSPGPTSASQAPSSNLPVQ